MSRDEVERLRDILDAIHAITEYGALARRIPESARLARDAILYNFVVIGEAAKSLSAQTTAGAPEIPWDDVAGLSDVIAHEYFHIQMRIIEDTVERDLPRLEAAVERLLKAVGTGDG